MAVSQTTSPEWISILVFSWGSTKLLAAKYLFHEGYLEPLRFVGGVEMCSGTVVFFLITYYSVLSFCLKAELKFGPLTQNRVCLHSKGAKLRLMLGLSSCIGPHCPIYM